MDEFPQNSRDWFFEPNFPVPHSFLAFINRCPVKVEPFCVRNRWIFWLYMLVGCGVPVKVYWKMLLAQNTTEMQLMSNWKKDRLQPSVLQYVSGRWIFLSKECLIFLKTSSWSHQISRCCCALQLLLSSTLSISAVYFCQQCAFTCLWCICCKVEKQFHQPGSQSVSVCECVRARVCLCMCVCVWFWFELF